MNVIEISSDRMRSQRYLLYCWSSACHNRFRSVAGVNNGDSKFQIYIVFTKPQPSMTNAICQYLLKSYLWWIGWYRHQLCVVANKRHSWTIIQNRFCILRHNTSQAENAELSVSTSKPHVAISASKQAATCVKRTSNKNSIYRKSLQQKSNSWQNEPTNKWNILGIATSQMYDIF